MSLVSPTQVSDGTTADASDINTPVNQLAAVINGGIDDNNINTTANIQGSKIATSTITNTQMSTEVKPVTRTSEGSHDFVASGCVWTGDAYASTLLASMTAGVVYISGVRIAVSAVSARAFTASKDTYIDLGSDGTLDYTEVANNAASPALAADHIRVGIIVSGGSSIANAGSVNQGQTTKVLPIASSIPYAVTDSLGNLICPRSPSRGQIGYRQATANTSTNVTASGSTPTVTGLTMPIIIPAYRSVEITYQGSRVGNDTANSGAELSLWDGATGSGTLLDTMNVNGVPINNFGVPMTGVYTYVNNTASAVSKTFRVGLLALTGGNATLLFISNTTIYGKISARLI